MNPFSKKNLFNKYYLSAFFLLILISFLSWAIDSQYFSALFVWDLSGMAWPRDEYLQHMFPFFLYPIGGFTMMQLLIPVFATMIVMPFLKVKKCFSFVYQRTKSYSTFLIKTILKYLLLGCIILFLAYIVFLLIGYFMLSSVDTPNFDRVLFSDILGITFFKEQSLLFYIIDGFWKYFVFCFVYGLFAIAVSFLTSKTYLSIVIPVVYYLGLDILCTGLLSGPFYYFSPSYSIVPDGVAYVNFGLLFLPLLPVLLFSLIVIGRELFAPKKENDIYAIN